MSIVYEDMKSADYSAVKKLINQAWFSEYTFSKGVIDLYEKGYLYMYLAELDYCKVAKDGDRVVGFIFGRCGKVPFAKKLHYDIKLASVGFRLLFTRAGRRGLKINRITNKANKALYKMANLNTKAELVLFICDEEYQGQGIGTKLQDDFCEYLKKCGINQVYLYTDTYSNFEYYEHRGYKRCGEIEVNFNIPNEDLDGNPKYFIYVKGL